MFRSETRELRRLRTDARDQDFEVLHRTLQDLLDAVRKLVPTLPTDLRS